MISRQHGRSALRRLPRETLTAKPQSGHRYGLRFRPTALCFGNRLDISHSHEAVPAAPPRYSVLCSIKDRGWWERCPQPQADGSGGNHPHQPRQVRALRKPEAGHLGQRPRSCYNDITVLLLFATNRTVFRTGRAAQARHVCHVGNSVLLSVINRSPYADPTL